ncbi:hypothetical protein BXZ70DRAFT_201774 [Cristinia sonorae]|uniref:F-box domain-containing protein n=1 Tax=Cristinia sonorae TaxID=1940300 RepID=A0A8K0XPL1_9AGAR|nr:hypothetical protein BXZ70DRAFT_201774 [Cristinia sonorae]
MKNARCTINRLPGEILAKVFEYVAMMTKVPSILKLQHVCRYWRRTLDIFPDPWSVVRVDETTKYEAIDYCILKSGSRPLTIAADPSPKVFEVLCKQLHRLRNLQMWSTGEDLDNEVLNLPAPKLEVLSCWCSPTDPYSTPPLPLIFGGQTPCLRKLVLGGFVSWSPQFRNLVHIDIFGWGDMEDRQESSTGLYDLVRLLQACPTLEILRLTDLDPWISWYNPSVSSRPADIPVNLPNLRQVFVARCSSGQAIKLFECFRVPRGASLSLERIHHPVTRGSNAITTILDANPSPFLNLADLRFLTISFAVESRFASWSGPSGQLVVEFSGALPQYQFLETFSLSQLSNRIQELVILDCPAIMGAEWGQFLAAFPALQKLTLRCESKSSGILPALSQDTGSSPRVHCPQLHSLHILDYLQLPTNPSSESEPFYKDILSCARSRHEVGYSIRDVRVTIRTSSNVGCMEKAAMEIGRFVEHVEVTQL